MGNLTPNLRILTLQGNNISEIYPWYFEGLIHLTRLDINANPLVHLELPKTLVSLQMLMVDEIGPEYEFPRLTTVDRSVSLYENDAALDRCSTGHCWVATTYSPAVITGQHTCQLVDEHDLDNWQYTCYKGEFIPCQVHYSITSELSITLCALYSSYE